MKFIILCYPRTGSTLLITALGAHPKINQGFDIFNPEQEGSDPWVHWRQETLKVLYGEQETYLNTKGYLDGQRFDLSLLAKEFFKTFDGTKIMYDQLDRHSRVWDYLRSLTDLRVLVLKRNIIEAAVSFQIAMKTNVWFVPNEKSYIWYVDGPKQTPPSPCLTYPTWYFDWFYNYYCSSEEFFVNIFKNHAPMIVDYHSMISDWDYTIRSVQEYLGVDPIDIPMMFEKRTQGTIEKLISNYDEIRTYYEKHPVLAPHFEAVSQSSKQVGIQLGKKDMDSTPLSNASVVITTCEVNQNHGTGVLVKRIISNTPNVLSIRSMNLYGGDHDFGDVSLCISHGDVPRQEVLQNVSNTLGQHTIQQILCIPYTSDDLVTAIAIHDLKQVVLAAYIMDDQNICVNNIPDQLMQEFLSKCSLRLVTHPEIRDVYEAKYGLKFWLLPAVVSEQLISSSSKPSESNSPSLNVGALIGAIENWPIFELLCTTINGAKAKLDWYNGAVDQYSKTQYLWLQDNPEKINELGITPCGLLSEDQLAETLKSYPYVLVPVGELGEGDRNPRLWRIIFAVATANIPVIVLDAEKTSAAHFVQQFNVGIVCDYDGESLRQAINRISDVKVQQQMRENAALVAPRFSARGINQWLWESVNLGEPCDFRFEGLLLTPSEKARKSFADEPVKVCMTNEEVYQYFPSSISEAYAGHIVDSNNVDYVDMMSGWGSNILGYGNQRVAEAVSAQMLRYSNTGIVGAEWHRLSELFIRLIPCAEAIHLVKNGSDATAAAIRLARSVTGREKVLHRGYHGVQDWYMASIRCPGVPTTHYGQIISITTLDVEIVKQALDAHPGEIACLILDPMVWPIPDRETMLAIQDLLQKDGALLIFDEVVSGFRVAIGGAQELWGVLPDLACYGKCIANGLPLAVLVGSEKWMQQIPSVNYGLTFSLEAVSIIAAIETINEIIDRNVCSDLAEKGRILKQAYSDMCKVRGIESALVGHDCRPEIYFENVNGLSPEYCKKLIIHELCRQRVCTYGTFNLCYAHTHKDIETVIQALECGLDKVKIAIRHPTDPEKHTWIQLQEDISSLRGQLSQSQAELTKAREEIEAMKSSKFWKIRTFWFSIKQRFSLITAGNKLDR